MKQSRVKFIDSQSTNRAMTMIQPGALFAHLAEVIRTHAQELTSLDQAIGDGDHGVNMRRGFDALAAISEELDSLAPGAALQKAGMTLVMKVGGASGPLYGSLLMAAGKALTRDADVAHLAEALTVGIDAVMQRGKAQTGDKTLLDVLVPVSKTLAQAANGAASSEEILTLIRDAAAQGLESTRDMKALKGRASFLGERSIGHLDPGARSAQLLIQAVCDRIGEHS